MLRQDKTTIPVFSLIKVLHLNRNGTHFGQNGFVRSLGTHFYIKGFEKIVEELVKVHILSVVYSIKKKSNKVPAKFGMRRPLIYLGHSPNLSSCCPVAKVVRLTNAMSFIPVLEATYNTFGK